MITLFKASERERFFKRLIGLIVLGIHGSLGGCLGQYDYGEVWGTVTLDGMPYDGGGIVFVGSESRKGVHRDVEVYCPLDHKGQYRAVGSTGSGLVPGTYRVRIVPAEFDEAFQRKPINMSEKIPLPKRIPVNYQDAELSKLQLVVKPGKNHFDVAIPAATP